MKDIPSDLAFFFSKDPALLPLFCQLSDCIHALYPSASCLVQKSQISFRDPRPFFYAWLPAGRIKRPPMHSLGLTFGLGEPVRHPRILHCVEPYPGRFTHHLLLTCPEELDDTLQGWIRASHCFRNPQG